MATPRGTSIIKARIPSTGSKKLKRRKKRERGVKRDGGEGVLRG